MACLVSMPWAKVVIPVDQMFLEFEPDSCLRHPRHAVFRKQNRPHRVIRKLGPCKIDPSTKTAGLHQSVCRFKQFEVVRYEFDKAENAFLQLP